MITTISNFLLILLEYFKVTTISTLLLPAYLVLSLNCDWNLNDSESVILSFGSSLQMFLNSYEYIPVIIHWYHYIIIFCITYLCLIYLTYAISKLFNIFKCYLFVCSIHWSCCSICSCSSNCYSSFNKYVCITFTT